MYLDRWCHRISVASTNPQFCGDCGDDGILGEAIHFEALIPEECDGSCGIGFEGGGAYEGTDGGTEKINHAAIAKSRSRKLDWLCDVECWWYSKTG